MILSYKIIHEFSDTSFDNLFAFAPHHSRYSHCFQLPCKTSILTTPFYVAFNIEWCRSGITFQKNFIETGNLSVFMCHLKHINLRYIVERFIDKSSRKWRISGNWFKGYIAVYFWSVILWYILSIYISSYIYNKFEFMLIVYSTVSLQPSLFFYE